MGCEPGGKQLRHHRGGCLGQAVFGTFDRDHLGAHGGDEQHGAVAVALACDHPPGNGLGKKESPAQIDVHDDIEILRGDVEHVAAHRRGNSGIRNEAGDGTEFGLHPVEQCQHVIDVGDVVLKIARG